VNETVLKVDLLFCLASGLSLVAAIISLGTKSIALAVIDVALSAVAMVASGLLGYTTITIVWAVNVILSLARLAGIAARDHEDISEISAE